MSNLHTKISRRCFTTAKKQTSHDSITSKQFFRNLPKVPMTKYLEKTELSKDMLYSGYRPIMYPVKQNPLFRNKNNLIIDYSKPSSDSDNNHKLNSNGASKINEKLFGLDNSGGIETCGVNGTWKYMPMIPTKFLPFNIWNCSCMVMEIYKEWEDIPQEIIKNLKPFDKGRN